MLSGAQAQMEDRCQCFYKDWIGDCQAEIELNGGWFTLTSDTMQCSRVEWFIDGKRQASIITEGTKKQEWLGQSASPEIGIQRCKVCTDSRYPQGTVEPDNTIKADLLGRWRIQRWVTDQGTETNSGYLEILSKVDKGRYQGEFYARQEKNGHWAKQRVEITVSGNRIYLRGSIRDCGGGKTPCWYADSFELGLTGKTMSGDGVDSRGEKTEIVFSR